MDKIIDGIDELKSSGEYDTLIVDSLENVLDEINSMKRNELLEQHPYKIWQGKDGEWYTYLPNEKGGRSLKHRASKKAIEDVVVAYIKAKIESPTVKDIFEEWLNKKLEREEIEKATFSKYQRDFNRFFGKIQNKEIKKITELDIEDFLKDTIREKSLSRKAFSNMRTLTYGIFRYAKKRGLVSFNIHATIADIEFSKREFCQTKHADNEQVFMKDEERKITDYLVSHQDLINLGLLLLFKSGLRIGELSVLKPCDISGCEIHVNKTETIYKADGAIHYDIKDTAKTPAGVRTVLIPKQYEWILNKLRLSNPFGEFVFMQDNQRIRSYKFRSRLYTICQKLDIVVKSPHKIRKTYGTKLYDIPDLERSFIARQMGHTEISCLEKHYYFNRSEEDEKVETINNLNVI
jgi:integrase